MSAATTPLYPLTLHPAIKDKVWGGDSLTTRFGYTNPDDAKIGEVWLVDGNLPIANGPLAGSTLDDHLTAALLGETAPADISAFPLLLKFLDARENLSVQSHPDDAYARRVEHVPYGKSEAWYILHAEPGAVVYHGVEEKISPDEARAAMREGRVDDVLHRVPVSPGDVVINPAGTIHAVGAGIVLYEVQQSSDITYRLYDWNRDGSNARPLHLDKGMEVADLQPLDRHTVEPVTVETDGCPLTYLCACRYFCSQLVIIPSSATCTLTTRHCDTLTLLEGTLELTAPTADPSNAGAESLIVPNAAPLTLEAGRAAVIPAVLGSYTLRPGPIGATLIRSFVPDLQADVIAPLRAAGIPTETIAQLGGDPRISDLTPLL